MEPKSANPFLFAEDDYADNSSASNPFLMNDSEYNETIENDNPFLSQAATTASTNPFAFDPMDLEPAEGEVAVNITDSYQTHHTTDSFMTLTVHYDTVTTYSSQNVFENDVNVPQKPTELALKQTTTDDAKDIGRGPMRPPPPRPPPSKETQDLLMSVMGAMDATSSHLLDKIPPTRTPSPVSMRDLHSPSPTPEPAFEDLLDVDNKKPLTTIDKPDSNDLLSLGENPCDINQNPPTCQPPPRPAPPPVNRPPRPQPPQKPPPPPSFSPARPKPPPPVVSQEKVQNQPEMIDMFGVETTPIPPQKTVASTADILSLYSAPKTTISQPKEPDLLFDSIPQNGTVNQVESSSLNSSRKNSNTEPSSTIVEVTDSIANTPLVNDNFISPEPSQSELQMDTSDSQSKDSVSSVTFNPFAATDETSPPKPLAVQADAFAQNQPEFISEPESSFVQPEPLVQKEPFVPEPVTIPEPATIPEPPQENIFPIEPPASTADIFGAPSKTDEFDAFAMKFESAAKDEVKNGATDAFTGGNDAWGADVAGFDSTSGFGNEEPFDAFLSLQEPPCVPQSTPNKLSQAPSQDSDEEKDFSVFIRPKTDDQLVSNEAMPVLAPPPAAPIQTAFNDTSPRFNPFDQQTEFPSGAIASESVLPYDQPKVKRSESEETPPTPLFDEDVSQPLLPFPRTIYTEEGWEMHLRQPNKKKITGQRFWKKIFMRLVNQSDCILLQLFNQKGDKDPFQELPLQPCYSVSDIGAQQYDQYGKIFTVKLQYIFYKERPGVRPGQVKKAERITNKLTQFASYAIQGDYQGVKEFGSDLKKLGLPVEHAPQVSQLMKIGSLNFEDLKQFSVCIEEALFKIQAHRDRALHYKMEEVQITAVDELYVDQDAEGHIERQIARVRLFFLGFLTGMPDIELGVNDMRRQGKEVVGRHDIIPVVTEEWIRLEEVEFHSCIQQEDYNNSHIIKFKPPDACYIELMRFRVRPPKNRELPLQLKVTINVTGNRVTINADVLVPGFASRKLGQIPCEDVMIRIPIPECWIYLFRVEKHFRYGSVKSTHRRTGKIKGIERILGTMETLQESLIEVTSGQAKYEHQHRAIVWRCPRLPKEGQGAYTTHNLVCRLALTSYDQIPDQLAEHAYVEFTMPATQVSHTTVRSVSLQNSDSDEPPEKYVRYLARHEYKVGIEHTEGEGMAAYSAATTFSKPQPVQEEQRPQPIPENESSDESDD